MHARVSTIVGQPGQEDVGISDFKNAVVPWVKEHGGRGGILLVDRAAGKAVALTLWSDEENMLQSEEEANEHRRRVSEEMQSTGAPMVERYEVVVFEV